MFKLSQNCAHFTCQEGNAQSPSSKVSAVCEPRNSRCTSCIQKRQKNQRSNCQYPLDHRKSKRIPEKKIYFCFIDYAKAFDCVDHNKLWKILKEMGTSDHFTSILRNLYAGLTKWTWNNKLVPNWEKSTARLYIVTLLI